ncbi:MAG: hypothetical protein ABI539_04675 [Acidobacteriota bacterium]
MRKDEGPYIKDSRGLRIAALIAVFLGGVGSLFLMFRIGQSNPSIILMAMFTVWVASPFVGLAAGAAVLKRWQLINETMLYCLMLVIPAVSLALYIDVYLRPRPQPAFMFLVVPFCSWLAMLLFFLAQAFMTRRRSAN